MQAITGVQSEGSCSTRCEQTACTRARIILHACCIIFAQVSAGIDALQRARCVSCSNKAYGQGLGVLPPGGARSASSPSGDIKFFEIQWGVRFACVSAGSVQTVRFQPNEALGEI